MRRDAFLGGLRAGLRDRRLDPSALRVGTALGVGAALIACLLKVAL